MDFEGHVLSSMNTSFPLIHLLFLQTQSITDDINYVNIQKVLSMSSSFSNMLIFEIHLKCRDDGEELSIITLEKRKLFYLCNSCF